jgi:hypothetical protein
MPERAIALSTPQRDSDDANRIAIRFTDRTGMSTLTPDSGFKEIAWRMPSSLPMRRGRRDNYDIGSSSSDSDGNSHSDSYSEDSRQSADSTRSPRQRSRTASSAQSAMTQSLSDPAALIGWRVFVEKFGLGMVVALKRRKFSTTKFEIQFDNGQVHVLALKRGLKKGSVPFSLIKKII